MVSPERTLNCKRNHQHRDVIETPDTRVYGELPIHCVFGGFGVFPDRSRPKVLWVGLSSGERVWWPYGMQSVENCWGKVWLLTRGHFSLTLTIAGARDRGVPILPPELTDGPKGTGRPSRLLNMEFTASEVVLFQSELGPGEYALQVARIGLGGTEAT